MEEKDREQDTVILFDLQEEWSKLNQGKSSYPQASLIIKNEIIEQYPLKRALLGFIIALFFAVSLGMAAGFSKPVYYLLRPLVLINKAVPTMAMILLALIWLESERAPILVGFVVIFPVIYENVVEGIRNVDVKLVEMMNIYEINKLDRLKDLYIPSIQSFLFGGMSAAMGLNLKINHGCRGTQSAYGINGYQLPNREGKSQYCRCFCLVPFNYSSGKNTRAIPESQKKHPFAATK